MEKAIKNAFLPDFGPNLKIFDVEKKKPSRESNYMRKIYRLKVYSFYTNLFRRIFSIAMQPSSRRV
jgi:hypothetical protein